MPALLIFYRLIVRPMRREPVRTLLTLFSVALGVAVLLAIELAGTAAAGSFRASMETLAGDADFEVTAIGGVPAAVYATLATLPYPLALTARIEDFAAIEGRGVTVPLIGVDRPAAAWSGGCPVTASPEFGYRKGDTLGLRVGGRRVECRVEGLLGANTNAIAMDLERAAFLVNKPATLDRILIGSPEGDEWEARLRAALPPGVTLARQGARTQGNQRMLAAFRWNLRVLSYIALVVGAFFIYNTISVSVVRRRAEIGIVRALGATRGGVLAAFLAEAAFFGIVGGLLGLALGRLMAEGAVQMLAATVESLYVSSRPAPVQLTPVTALLALLAGLSVSVISALAPAREAAEVSPVDAMARARREHLARTNKTRDLVWAALLGLAGAAAARLPAVGGKPLFGYAAAFLLIGACALAIPALVEWLSGVAGARLAGLLGVEALLASRSVAASLRRTSVLVGALATAVAMMASVAIMVGSFRETVLVWMDAQLKADLYLRPGGAASADRHPVIDASLAGQLKSIAGIEAIDRFRAYQISFRGLPATLAGGETQIVGRFGRTRFLDGDREEILRALPGGDNVIVSEPLASKHNLKRGGAIELPLGSAGHKTFHVLGVYYDYANERGYIVMDRATLLKYLPDPAPSNIAVYVQRGADFDAVRREVERAAGAYNVAVFTNSALRRDAIAVFDRTFAITYALEAVAVTVAVLGMAGALLALVIDRRRELSLLRFLGAAKQQVRRLILFEAGLLGLLANIAGLALGYVLSLILIYVINKQSFGWTIQFHWPVAILLFALSGVYAATVIAGLYPARVATRLNPIEVIHEE